MLDEKGYDILLRRFRHLLKSETIKKFDEWDREKNQYKNNILDLDRYIENLKNRAIALEIENWQLKIKLRKDKRK